VAQGRYASAGKQTAATAFAITVLFELVDGAFARFHELVSDNARQSVESEAGCLRFDVLTPVTAEGSQVFLYEIYEDRAAFDVHLASTHFKLFDQLSRDLVRNKIITAYAVEENAKIRDTA
jgi:autoinducer 2-degrading protein